LDHNASDIERGSNHQRHNVLDVKRVLVPEPRLHYLYHPFEVPQGATKVGLTLSFFKEKLAQIFVSLHDPNGFRGNRMNPGGKGQITLDLWVTPGDASEGGLAGEIEPGTWTVQIDIERLGEETEYRLQAYVEMEPAQNTQIWTYPDNHVVNPSAGWYKGELHAHSTESDAKYPVETVVQAAIDTGLDFLSLTDHFTVSQWRKMAPLVNERTALIRSCELTSHQGHANLQGINKWVDVYVDRDDWTMDQVAEEVHSQGGLFCVNHPFSGDLGWRSYDFDWNLADLMEIYHNLEGCNNVFQGALWDHHLQVGRRLVGVGGTDSHDPFKGKDQLGQLVTWVYATELSERGIIEGLRNGRVYVSRGPELRFMAEDAAGNRAEMWESLPSGQGPITFTASIKTDEPLRLFIIKNGYPFETTTIANSSKEWQTVNFHDSEDKSAYYRLELHAPIKNDSHPGIKWRDYESVRALSNPILVGNQSEIDSNQR
jgi:hypothetical protein